VALRRGDSRGGGTRGWVAPGVDGEEGRLPSQTAGLVKRAG
jgi:hypothetical protein